MTKTAFDKIKAALNDAIAFARGDETRGAISVPETVAVRAIRKSTGLSQEQFAAQYSFGLWPETSRRAELLRRQRRRRRWHQGTRLVSPRLAVKSSIHTACGRDGARACLD
jgi:hypothetical protein